MMRKIRRPLGTRRLVSGITLVELLVGLAGMTLVMGIAYDIYDETLRASRKMIHRQSALDYGVTVIDATSKLLHGAIHPDDLDLKVSVGPSFSGDSLSVLSYSGAASNGLKLVTIFAAGDDDEGPPYRRRVSPVPGATGEGPAEESAAPLGTNVEGFTPTLSFRYATEAKAGSPINYVDSLKAGQWPVLIEITVSSELIDHPGHPVVLTTSVIPGRLPRS